MGKAAQDVLKRKLRDKQTGFVPKRRNPKVETTQKAPEGKLKMATENWHGEFNPRKFLSRVCLEKLIERNETYNATAISDAKTPCILCGKVHPRGILLNDKSFLCQQCYSEAALISYPEKYETLRRESLLAKESRRLAWEGFRERFEYKPAENSLVIFGWASLLLVFISPAFLVLTVILLVIGYQKNSISKQKAAEWISRRSQWEQANPEPKEPALKHFHDPTAELTQRDRLVLRIFDHWPGYPPFWKYLRSVIFSRDSNRCQVTGCPSRLGLQAHHIRPVSEGGAHSPDNLISLCDFHHALEPSRGHERIWGNVKTKYFTLVCSHERSNRTNPGVHTVRPHLRRLQLVTLDELRELTGTYGFCCPNCRETRIKFILHKGKNIIKVECSNCGNAIEGPQQLTEETGPRLAEILGVTRNRGRWKARWDVLVERRCATWGKWKAKSTTKKNTRKRATIKTARQTPNCPKCGARMRLIKPQPKDHWTSFWGCTQYRFTGCNGKVEVEAFN